MIPFHADHTPALSSTSRRKSHYRGKEIRTREKGVDAFACNQVRLLLTGFGYQIMHVQRAVFGACDRHRLPTRSVATPRSHLDCRNVLILIVAGQFFGCFREGLGRALRRLRLLR